MAVVKRFDNSDPENTHEARLRAQLDLSPKASVNLNNMVLSLEFRGWGTGLAEVECLLTPEETANLARLLIPFIPEEDT